MAAVSEMSIATATAGSHLGVQVDLRYGDVLRRGYVSRPVGTAVTIRNLFANLPARLKFIGNARAESSLISGLVRRYALAHPSVRFHLTLDGHPSLHTSGLGLDEAVGEVFGATVGQAFLPLGPLTMAEAEGTG